MFQNIRSLDYFRYLLELQNQSSKMKGVLKYSGTLEQLKELV